MNERLANDTLPLLETPMCHVRVSRDSRWPWILIVPRRDEVCELHELSADEQWHVLALASQISEFMKQRPGCTSVNIAMLGNVVSQLHCHVVARSEGDPNWPAPVWGFGEAAPYHNDEVPAFALALKEVLVNASRRNTYGGAVN